MVENCVVINNVQVMLSNSRVKPFVVIFELCF